MWARHPASLDALGTVVHVRRDRSKDLAASCGIVALFASTDEDVMQKIASSPAGPIPSPVGRIGCSF